MSNGLDVRPFTEAALRDAIRAPRQTPAQAEVHAGAGYLFRYLSALGARTLVVEHDYTDRDYLDDYANYYVRSFEDYGRRCRRLHFFTEHFDAASLLPRLTASAPDAALQASYLGFVVARPLPSAVVGRTVLRTYPPDGGRRHYPSTRSYTAHLFGTPLDVESLAFQEQDTVLAACATVALWSAFHKAADLFDTPAPTPAQITRAASPGLYTGRALPSRGLNIYQMARAISEAGLEPEVFECSANLPLLSLLHGYLALGVVPVLTIDIAGVGLHAVAVTGYSLKAAPVHQAEDAASAALGFRRIGLRIDELYVHDDGHGPFAKITVRTRTPGAAGESAVYFDGTWTNPATGKPAELEPKSVLVPVYHKVRLTFIDVQQWVARFNMIAQLLVAPQDMSTVEWQVVLGTTGAVKSDLKASTADPATVERVLLRQQPRFMWRAILRVAERPLVELLLDATDMQRSVPLHDIVFYDAAFRAQMAAALVALAAHPIQDKQAEEFFTRLRAAAT